MKERTKTNKLIILLALGFALDLLQPLTSHAALLYRLTWSGTAMTQGTNGQVVTYPFNQQMFVNKVAQDNNLDPATLVFVYRSQKRDTAVVKAATGEFVADVIQLEDQYTDVGKAGGPVVAKQAFLDDEYHQNHIGSIVGVERTTRDASGKVIGYVFSGVFQMTMPDRKTVYYGNFTTGPQVLDKTHSP